MVLEKSPTTHTKVTPTTISNKLASTPSSDSHGFSVYLLTTVGTSEVTIRIPFPVPIRALPYLKAMIAKTKIGSSDITIHTIVPPFIHTESYFKRDDHHSLFTSKSHPFNSSFVSFHNSIPIVASYFDTNSSFEEFAVESIRHPNLFECYRTSTCWVPCFL